MIKVLFKETKDIYTTDTEEILQKYEKKLQKLGYDIKDMKYLGEGTMGEAYLLKSGKVLKITGDKSEAKSSALIVKKPTKNLVRVERVLEIKDRGYYIIIMEYLEPISPEEMDFWNELSDTNILEKILSKPTSWQELKPKLAKEWKKWDSKTVTKFFLNAEKYNFPQMMDELYKYGITFYDFHGDNIKKRGKDSVVFDLGYSKQQKSVDIQIIEKKIDY